MSAAAGLSARIRKRYGGGFELNVEFEAPAGITILFGASGAGKTTILDCVAGLQTPDVGAISIGGTSPPYLGSASGRMGHPLGDSADSGRMGYPLFDSAAKVNLPVRQRHAGYLFQTLALFPHMSVVQNIEYGLAALDVAEKKARVAEIMESFHIAGLSQRRPGEISGGERQRVALARTLVTRPCVLLLDEPLTALDAATKAKIVADLRAWNERFRIPILYVTHDREEVFALGEQMLVLEDGRVVAQGLPHDVVHRPELESVAQLAGFENVFDGSVVERHVEQGTMACRIAGSQVELEVPLTRVDAGQSMRVGIRAGDIMVATVRPEGLSARNVIAGTVRKLEQRDVIVIAHVDCGAVFEVHVTPGAVRSLELAEGSKVWIVIKTYSCRVLR